MKNQHEGEKRKQKPYTRKRKKQRKQLKKEEDTEAFLELIKIVGCTNNNAGTPNITQYFLVQTRCTF